MPERRTQVNRRINVLCGIQRLAQGQIARAPLEERRLRGAQAMTLHDLRAPVQQRVGCAVRKIDTPARRAFGLIGTPNIEHRILGASTGGEPSATQGATSRSPRNQSAASASRSKAAASRTAWRHKIQIFVRINAVIHRVDEDVVAIERGLRGRGIVGSDAGRRAQRKHAADRSRKDGGLRIRRGALRMFWSPGPAAGAATPRSAT
jgi:hypothetical protein